MPDENSNDNCRKGFAAGRLRGREYPPAVEQLPASSLPAACAGPSPAWPVIPTARWDTVRNSVAVGVVERVGYTVAVGVGVVGIQALSHLPAVGQTVTVRIRGPSVTAVGRAISDWSSRARGGLLRRWGGRTFWGSLGVGEDLPERILAAIGRIGIHVGIIYRGCGGIRTRVAVGLGDLGPVRDRFLVVGPAEEYACQDPGEDKQREQGQKRWQQPVVTQERIHD